MKYISDINEHGTADEKLERAKNVDLITLPKDIKGTNCANCKFIDIEREYCTHKDVAQKVSPRMCCALWDAEGVKREWETKKEEK